jgi:predicted RNA-binding Zn-ribbon protein involved in translation (DUF1610 family)
MAISTQCTGCNAQLKLKEEFAGKNIKCPRCGHIFLVTSNAVAPSPEPERIRTRPPADEEDVPVLEPVRARRDRDEDEDEDDRPRPRRRRKGADSAYVPCPKCEAEGAERVTWTPWGSFYGPALFNHVRCPECGYAYNGKTGGSNLIPAIIFVTIPLLLILGIIGGLFYYVLVVRYM